MCVFFFFISIQLHTHSFQTAENGNNHHVCCHGCWCCCCSVFSQSVCVCLCLWREMQLQLNVGHYISHTHEALRLPIAFDWDLYLKKTPTPTTTTVCKFYVTCCCYCSEWGNLHATTFRLLQVNHESFEVISFSSPIHLISTSSLCVGEWKNYEFRNNNSNAHGVCMCVYLSHMVFCYAMSTLDWRRCRFSTKHLFCALFLVNRTLVKKKFIHSERQRRVERKNRIQRTWRKTCAP